MSTEVKKEIQLEIAHVLFIDIVAYSKLAIDDQRAAIEKLNRIVQSTDQFREAESENRLLKIAAGDGMALIFYQSPEDPVECALQISRAIKKEHANLGLRMGVHSGPVSGVMDVTGRTNVAGAGINTAQRVMSCGDAGHILLSKRVADDLEQFKHWRPHLHDLGECEVKHDERISLVNLFTGELGNSERPKLLASMLERKATEGDRSRNVVPAVAACTVLVALAIGGFVYWQRHKPKISTPVSTISEKSIAVLPFENRSEEKSNAYFADGIQDEILANLARIADLKVISRTSVTQYRTGVVRNLPEIGQQLRVAHIVEGGVQRTGNRVRVNAQLIDARNDAHLWAQTYDRDLSDVFAIQSEIAKAIADQLQAKLSPTEKAAIVEAPTRNLEAYDRYLRAKNLAQDIGDQVVARQILPELTRLLEEAVNRDPNFLRAWTLLSRVSCFSYFTGVDRTPTRLDKARVAVEAAQRLAPESGETRLARAEYLHWGIQDDGEARRELALAGQSLPNSSQVFALSGEIDRRAGRMEEATRDLERAMELDPRDVALLTQVWQLYRQLHRYSDGIRVCDQILSFAPGHVNAQFLRAVSKVDRDGDIKPFQAMLAAVLAENPSREAEVERDVDDERYAVCERSPTAAARVIAGLPREGVVYNGVNFPYAYLKGFVLRCQGDDAAARVAFAEARETVEKTVAEKPNLASALSLLGLIDAGLGRKDDAIREGRRACDMLPASKDAVDGAALEVYLAQIYTWVGEKDSAIAQIKEVQRKPNHLSHGLLKLSPIWDPLRGDPRFEKIVASLAPK